MNNENQLRLRLALGLPERLSPNVKPSGDCSDVGDDENKSSSAIDQGKGKSLYQAGVAPSWNETRLDLAAELHASARLTDKEILRISCLEHQELLRQRALGLSKRRPSDDRGTSLDLAAERREYKDLRLWLALGLPKRPSPKVKSSSAIDQGKGKSLYRAGVAPSWSETRFDLAADLHASARLTDDEILRISCLEHQELLRQRALGLSERKPSDDRGTSLGLAAERRISVLLGDNEILRISRREYKELLHRKVLGLSEIKPSDDHGDVRKSLHQAESSSSGNDKARSNESEPTSFVCGICWDESPSSQIFMTRSCSHSFCTQCVGTYVATRIQENFTSIKCPGEKCQAILDPQTYLQIIPRDVAKLWDRVLCESLIPDSQKYYCPFRDCSALLVDNGGQVLTSCQCPICKRLFCVQCKVPWHSGLNCKEFERTKDSDLDRMVTDLAKSRQWKKCPNCNFYIEKSSGCRHMTCRCGVRFCYTCGKKDCSCGFIRRWL